jgi:2-hydroxy-3-oxopropionate reductase
LNDVNDVNDKTVGFIGLGAMGLPMARNLALAGFDVVAWNRSSKPLQAAREAGCHTVSVPAEVAAAPVVLTMLPDLPQVASVLDGPRGLLAAPGPFETLVVMGTVSPVAVRCLADDLAEKGRGIAVVDAPVSGGERGAADATLSIMAGGAPSAFARVRPYLEVMGTTVRHMGGVGAGSLTKACNQLVVAGTLVSLAEAVLLGERGGLDGAALLDVLGGGLASSEVLMQKRERLLSSDFTSSGPARYLLKDLGFALNAAAEGPTAVPITEAVTQLYAAVCAQGLGDLDNSVVLDLLRRMSTPVTMSRGNGDGDESSNE